jgi:hypothetical protein
LNKNRPGFRNRFELQALEPRVLLSADPLDLVNKDDASPSVDQTADEVVVAHEEVAQGGQKNYVIAYDPGAQVDDIFGGVGEAEAGANATPSEGADAGAGATTGSFGS